jgi:hypothetical protein
LLLTDRRSFAWEWMRRTEQYRAAWRASKLGNDASAETFGLLDFEDPDNPTPIARPIWAPSIDPSVLHSRSAPTHIDSGDSLDIRRLAGFVSVAVDDLHQEHWLLSDGRWSVRLDLHDGTLLGGPVYLYHEIGGLADAMPQMTTLKQLAALASRGEMPASFWPRESRAARWILELRTADALATGANQFTIARGLFGSSIAEARWRIISSSYRLRVQRLVRTARQYLSDPLSGPWFR